MEKNNKIHSIKGKLNKGFLFIIGIMLICIIANVAALSYISYAYKAAMEQYGFSQGYIGELGTEFNNARVIMKDIATTTDLAELKEEVSRLYESRIKMDDLKALVKETSKSKEEQELYQKLTEPMARYRTIGEEVIKLSEENKEEEASAKLKAEGLPLADSIRSTISEILRLNVNLAEDVTKRVNMISTALLFVIAAISAFGIISGSSVARMLSKGICNSLDQIVKAAKKIEQGDFDFEVQCKTNDEIEILANTFNEMIYKFKFYIEEIIRVTEEMSHYQLDTYITHDFAGEFSKIKTATNKIIDSFNGSLLKIDAASSEVAGGAKQVAEGASSLAESTTEESSVIEELLATVNEVADKVNKNSSNAQNAGRISELTQNVVNQGNQQMDEMVQAMQQISDNTNAIQTIIKSIEDISSQTNLLSLNASIEAARAGEAGRGFAVVAGEIGSLADQSGQAVKTTSELIEKCITATKNGVATVTKTAVSLKEIVEKTIESKGIIKDIIVSSKEQDASLHEILSGINQVAGVMQSNSAISQESAAASEELTSQADLLKQLIANYTLKKL